MDDSSANRLTLTYSNDHSCLYNLKLNKLMVEKTNKNEQNAAQVNPQQQAQDELESFMTEACIDFAAHNGFW